MLGRHDKPCAGIPGVACGQKPFVCIGWFKWAPRLGGNGQRKRPPPGFGTWQVIQMHNMVMIKPKPRLVTSNILGHVDIYDQCN